MQAEWDIYICGIIGEGVNEKNMKEKKKSRIRKSPVVSKTMKKCRDTRINVRRIEQNRMVEKQ